MKYTNPETKYSIGRRYSFKDIERETKRRSTKKDSHMKIIGLPKQFLFNTHGFSIYEVDGEWIRNNLYVWFGTGGHGRVHSFIPNREIWIEFIKSCEYTARTIIHEIAEFKAMNRLPFYHAHLQALKKELEVPTTLKILTRKLQEIK